MARIIFSKRARVDLRELADFYLNVSDQLAADNVIDKILDEIQILADRPLIKGKLVKGLAAQ